MFKTVLYLQFNFNLKIGRKMFTFKNMEEIFKTWRKVSKTIIQQNQLLRI